MEFTKLTDAEREEFIALAGETLDPELWDEDDLPLLRANKKKFEEAEGREESSPAPEGPAGGTVKVKDLSNDQLMALTQETYDKAHWLPDDVGTLRACWEEFQRRGGENAVMFFRPTYFDVLKFHEIDSGETGDKDVQMYERTGAQIAPDYREIMRKLRGVEAIETKQDDAA